MAVKSRRGKKQGVCIFCQTFGDLTREHIWPTWSHRYLPPRATKNYQGLRAVTYPDQASFKIDTSSGDIRDLRVRCVCNDCNNGWMSRLETAAKPILIPLIEGTETRVGASDLSLVATWASMKAMVAEHYGPGGGGVSTPQDIRTRMLKKRTPPEFNWFVWIGCYERRKWVPHFLSTPFQLLSDVERASRKDKRAAYFNGHISTQIIGKLFVHIARAPDAEFLRDLCSTPDRGLLFRIWPTTSEVGIRWPLATMSDRDADYVAEYWARQVEGAAKRLHAKDTAGQKDA